MSEKELNKKRGKRLSDCRKAKNLTQKELAKKVGYAHPNTISQLENGSRPLNWNKAVVLARGLDVNPAYLLCDSDIKDPERIQKTLDLDTFGTQDKLFINYLIAADHDLKFHVVRLYDGKIPKKRVSFGKEFDDWESLEEITTFDKIKDFCISDEHCMLSEDGMTAEIAITKVSIDDIVLSYGQFSFWMDQMTAYIEHIISSLNSFKRDIDMIDGINTATWQEIKLRHTKYEHVEYDEKEIAKLHKAIKELEQKMPGK